MYRDGVPMRDSSSSDEEFSPITKFARIRETDGTSSRKKLNVWSDVLQEREITEGVSESLGIQGDEAKVDRGSESYIIPESHLAGKSDPRRSALQRRPVTQYADSVFGDVAVDVEDKPHSGKDSSNDGKWKGHKGKRKKNGGRSGSQQRYHKDADGCDHHRQGGSGGGSRERDGRKRPWQDKKPAPKSFLADDYSPESLKDVQIPAGLPLNQLGDRMAKALGERNLENITTAVNAVGESLALKIFERTRQIESSGGMLVMDQSRRRTPGGVFMTLFKADPDVPQTAKDVMNEMQRNNSRDVKKVKRRAQHAAEEEGAIKQLPTALEVFAKESATARQNRVEMDIPGSAEKGDEMEEGEVSS